MHINWETNWEKNKSDFNDLVDLWDKALKDGIFEDAKPAKSSSEDFFGNVSNSDESQIGDSQSKDWDSIIARSGEMFPDENMVLMEAARKNAKKKETEGKPLGNLAGNKPFDYDKARVKTTLEKEGLNAKSGPKAKDLANLPQQVKADTKGKDGEDKSGKPRVTAGLAANPSLSALEKLKLKLYDIEVKMNTKDGLDDKKAKSMEKQFTKLLNQIEKISNEFSSSYSNSEYYS